MNTTNGEPSQSTRRPYKPRILKVEPFGDYMLEKWRCMGATMFPYSDVGRHAVEVGAYCSACAIASYRHASSWGETLRNREFLTREIPQHFLGCEALKSGYGYGKTPTRNFGITSKKHFLVKANGDVESFNQKSTEGRASGNRYRRRAS